MPFIPERMGYLLDPALALMHMQEVVGALNRPRVRTQHASRFSKRRVVRPTLSPKEASLRSLVELWKASGPNVDNLFAANPWLRKRLETGRTHMLPTSSGKACLEWDPFTESTSLSDPLTVALAHFAQLITNPRWAQLAGPCKRCEDYYLMKTLRQNCYCSRRCASRATAEDAVKKRRAAEQRRKILKAEAAIHEWQKRKRREDWKPWVARHANLTTRWITRAVNNGKLNPPSAHVHHIAPV